MNTKISSDIAEIKSEQGKNEKYNFLLKLAFAALEKRSASADALVKTVALLEAAMIDLEDGNRRSNLVVFGIPAEPYETKDMLKEQR